MSEVNFIYEGNSIIIQCDKNQKMRDICNNLSNKLNININSLLFLYGGTQLNFEAIYKELTEENKISILVYKNENEICPKCGKILNNKVIDEIITSNNKINYSLAGIKRQIEFIMTDITNKTDINYINSQLNNINVLINNINEDIKKINNQLNIIKLDDDKILKQNVNDNKEEILKNEIICIYNKQKNEIKLLHEYTDDLKYFDDEYKKLYKEGKNNVNEGNIDIYINDKKIKFNYKYKSNEKGNIKVKFIFNKLLTSTNNMFSGCSSIQSIDLSSFDTTNVNDMSYMFHKCSSLTSIDLSSFVTTKVTIMRGIFFGCYSLKSINLSSFVTTNVTNMSFMFFGCSSLQSIDLSSFNTTKVNNMSSMFDGCSSLKKENIKINNYDQKILEQINELENN